VRTTQASNVHSFPAISAFVPGGGRRDFFSLWCVQKQRTKLLQRKVLEPCVELCHEMVAGLTATTELFTPSAFARALAAIYGLECVTHLLLRRGLGSVSSDVVVQVRQCAVSFGHDVFAVLASTALLLSIEPHPKDASAYYVPPEHLRLVACCLFAFFFWDLLHMLTNLRLYRHVVLEQGVHHVLYMLMMMLNIDSTYYNYAFPILYMGELSSLFLNIRAAYRCLPSASCDACACHGGHGRSIDSHARPFCLAGCWAGRSCGRPRHSPPPSSFRESC